MVEPDPPASRLNELRLRLLGLVRRIQEAGVPLTARLSVRTVHVSYLSKFKDKSLLDYASSNIV